MEFSYYLLNNIDVLQRLLLQRENLDHFYREKVP